MKKPFLLIHAYILIHFIKSLFGSSILFLGIYIIITLIDQLGTFIQIADKTPFINFVMYFVYEFPHTQIYLFPICCLFSIVYSLGKLNSQNELIPIYNSGMSILYAVYPVILLVFLLCFAFFAFDESFIYKNHDKHRLLHQKFHHQTDRSHREKADMTVFGKNNKIYFIKLYQPRFMRMINTHILFLDLNYRFAKMISAKTLTYDVNTHLWTGSNTVIRTWPPDTNMHHDLLSNSTTSVSDQSIFPLTNFQPIQRKTIHPNIVKYESIQLDLDENPFHFKDRRTGIDHLGPNETLELALKFQTIGGPFEKYYTHYYNKNSMPFIALIIVFFGIPLSVFSRKSIIILSFFLVIVTTIAYFIIMYIGTSLGAMGILPPMVGGWFGNIIFFVISAFIYKKLIL